jgi:hypothetical protein
MDWWKESTGDPELDSWNWPTGNRRTWNMLNRVLLYTNAHKKIAVTIKYHNCLCWFFIVHQCQISQWSYIYKASTRVDCRFSVRESIISADKVT